MKLPVIYVLTHDSIFIGGDGPTHQPVEHLTSLRIIPNMMVLRPADPEEAVAAWQMAMDRKDGPSVLALSRQPVKVFPKHDPDWQENMRNGAYVVREPSAADGAGGGQVSAGTDGGRGAESGAASKPDVVIAATGSEVDLALEAADLVPEKRVRVVSVTCRELLMEQPEEFREALFPSGVRTIVAEAGVTCCWEGIASSPKDVFGINRFGESGPGEEVAAHLGYTAEGLSELIRKN
jgi:transketolase